MFLNRLQTLLRERQQASPLPPPETVPSSKKRFRY
jgi:hypothetical protein